MAASLPVLATDVGSLREMIVDGQTGRLSPAGDVEAFALALRECLADVTLLRRFGEAGRARLVSNFTRAAMVERTAQLLRDCAVGNSS
jgi:glycosyltransferase involved in cell wall biosynthesis